ELGARCCGCLAPVGHVETIGVTVGRRWRRNLAVALDHDASISGRKAGVDATSRARVEGIGAAVGGERRHMASDGGCLLDPFGGRARTAIALRGHETLARGRV